MKKFVFSIIALAVILLFLVGSLRSCQNIKADRDRLSQNQHALLEDITFYKTEDGESAAKVERLELTKREFEKQCADLKEEVNALGIKTKYLQSVINTTTKTEAYISTNVRDSIVYRNREQPPDTLRCFDFADPYLRVDGCVEKDTFSGHIVSYDSLIFVAHRVPKKFLFIRWGTKAVELDVVTKNPHSEIIYNRYIELRK
ncbi:hypothetical protein EZS27_029782 [termite gut metagenome]|uniref:Uncharacterized protein n=1 Tax=termite gut metagenome TaxID=433724 RepID=A0A5J4QEJ2_9ZZZZ